MYLEALFSVAMAMTKGADKVVEPSSTPTSAADSPKPAAEIAAKDSNDSKLEKATSASPVASESKPPLLLSDYCLSALKPFPGKSDLKALKTACDKVEVLAGCESIEKRSIFHYSKSGVNKHPARVLVFSLIHGDETPAGTVGRFWMERLETIEPRNNWRVVPVLNPDGVLRKTRTNANKVDVNRNFPTMDWAAKAMAYWKSQTSSNPRRFPGEIAASEPETLCALKHIEDFKPDFVVSVHTPLKVLDYDGPRVKPPKFSYLPWKSLGHYPGSLGRYLWSERKVPVLTMELKEDLPNSHDPFLQLQDIIGYLVSLELETKKVN